jgi:hypothetical protein
MPITLRYRHIPLMQRVTFTVERAQQLAPGGGELAPFEIAELPVSAHLLLDIVAHHDIYGRYRDHGSNEK